MHKNIGGSKTHTKKSKTPYKANIIIKKNKYTPHLFPIREEITAKLIWVIHGAEKGISTIPALSDQSMAHKKNVPKINFGPCYFDSISFFSPSGHYASLDDFAVSDIGKLLCNNQTEEKFEKIPDKNGNIQLRDMYFSVEPITDTVAFKEGMSVYLCVDNKNIRIINYDELIALGKIDLSTLISLSNMIMANRGFLHRKWDLLLFCCRVYQPNIIKDGVRFDKYTPLYKVITHISKKPNRIESSELEKIFGIPESKIPEFKKKIKEIRKPKTPRTAYAKENIRLTVRGRGGTRKVVKRVIPNSSIQQVSEEDFYKALSPVPINSFEQSYPSPQGRPELVRIPLIVNQKIVQ